MFLGVVTLPKNNPCLDLLLDPYLKLIDSDLNQSVGSNDIIKSISYTFPAVLEGLGKERWPKLIPLFTRLLKFTDQEVRAPLAFSLHEIGRLIGPEEAKEHLFHVWI
jgi:serine/threonine-protein phosphatase 4 regulatory subunit 1